MTDFHDQFSVSGWDVFDSWLAREKPPPIVRRAVVMWIDGLHDDPEQHPSQPVTPEHPHPVDPVRTAEVPETWVGVTYAINVDARAVRLLKIELARDNDG